ncbi:DUF3995 domain-containing protein [Octadecabacter sp. G9-8]|uniref:DUF3995 domain-containing protein n=1 Tax=Octadecabacter dasysiphoniae TaxID=2909341 RepID=A0ABS9CXI2_9RHOB|nr:DUF3995 domain-containing protein [Octadecabacter dasysiphoniae]MCF2871873.1 DUF3995 domain-containing protein [Octadecabacter dasysiphoniae]
MTILSLIASVGLIIIAALHLLWSLGYWWPIKDEAELARTVVGTKGVEKMPGAVACSLVVVALLFAAAWPWFPETAIKSLGLFGIAMVFQIRAVLAYAPFWKRATPEQPFRRLDEAYYGPLCIFFGVIFMILAGAAAA